MMKKTQLWRVIGLCFLLSACGGGEVLSLNTPDVRGDLDLKVKMQLLPTARTMGASYQEVSTDSTRSLDSLLIRTELSELSLPAFVQQELNQLRLNGYEITDEHSKKSKKLIGKEERPAILKTYRITSPLGKQLYIAQYGVDTGAKFVFLSYASETLSHRKAFISSLTSLIF